MSLRVDAQPPFLPPQAWTMEIVTETRKVGIEASLLLLVKWIGEHSSSSWFMDRLITQIFAGRTANHRPPLVREGLSPHHLLREEAGGMPPAPSGPSKGEGTCLD